MKKVKEMQIDGKKYNIINFDKLDLLPEKELISIIIKLNDNTSVKLFAYPEEAKKLKSVCVEITK